MGLHEVVLLGSLQQTQIGSAILQSAGTLAWADFALLAPSLYVCPAKYLIGFALADIVGICLIFFEQIYNLGCHISDEYGVWDAFVGKLKCHNISSMVILHRKPVILWSRVLNSLALARVTAHAFERFPVSTGLTIYRIMICDGSFLRWLFAAL